MSPTTSKAATNPERVSALFAWWGFPHANGTGFETHMKRFQAFAADLGKSCSDASSDQMRALFSTNERLARSLQELAHCRGQQEVVAVETSILAVLMEGASLQAKSWIELMQKIERACASMARDTAEEASRGYQHVAPAKPPAKI